MIEAWDDTTAANDRVAFAVFVAAIVHAAIILGIGFAREEPEPASESLEITLAQYRSPVTPEKADFIAQADQQGSGETSRRAELTSPVVSPFTAAEVQEVSQTERAPAPAEASESAVLTARESERLAPAQAPQEQATRASDAPAREQGEETRTAREIASLAALLDAQQRAYARLPRVHRLTSVSTRRAEDAVYLFNWKQRIESIGNRNYPAEARRLKLYGELRVLVALRADGSVLQTRVLKSSGYPVLDSAALRIVRMSAPFDAFPPELRKRADVLEIIRTWQFRSNRLTAAE